jgi:glycosyltransferase involved in cell wall biosynthesis
MTSAGGLDAALDAVESLDTPDGPLRLVALCRGRVERRFRERIVARATKAGERVLVAGGPLPESTVAAWYEAAAAVCLPATRTLDPTPAKLAAVAGKPCVAAEVDSLLEYVDDETGILVPVHDVGALRRALGLLVRDDELAARLGAVARRRADEELAPAAAARRLRHLWETVVHARVAANGASRAGTANGARAR